MMIKKLWVSYDESTREHDKSTREFNFHNKNLLFSDENSVGKSTILRMLFWSLGYKIPGTYKIKFDNLETEVIFENRNKIFYVKRYGNEFIKLYDKNNEEIFSYYFDTNDYDWMQNIWGIQSKLVLDNILGAIYMDQDKGWTLLNKGKVIGGIRFNARDLLIGLNNEEDDSNIYVKKLHKMDTTIRQTSQIINISQEANIKKSSDNKPDELNEKYFNLKLERNSKKNKKKELKKMIDDNEGVKKYILHSHIMIEHNGIPITITKDNLMNYDDNIDYLKTMYESIKHDISDINYKIYEIENKYKERTASLFAEDDVINNAINEFAKIPVDISRIEAKEKELKETRKDYNEAISKKFLDDNRLAERTENWIRKFAKILGVDEYIKSKKDIFTKDLKSISGTIYYKIVFSYKMAYIKVMEENLDIKLPIVLDSPSGREVTDRNISDVIGILNNYFKDNQIIIASIHKYDIPDLNVIKLEKSIFYKKI